MEKRATMNEKDMQGSGYTTVVFKIYQDPNSYNTYNMAVESEEMNNTNDNNLFNEILREYSSAWEILAKM